MARHWLKGNLHTHTTNSDGDSSPEVVAAWYRDHGYDFLALTDHDLLTRPGDIEIDPGTMLLVGAEELSPGNIHLNALGIDRAITPIQRAEGETVADVIRHNAAAITATGAVASINHPNFRWALSAADLLGIDDLRLLEVYNGGPDVNNLGGIGHPSTEAIWGTLLDAGQRIHAVAVDDAHHFQAWGRPWSNPGRGWLGVNADHDEMSILDAVAAGAFYASMGIVLEDLDTSGPVIALDIEQYDDALYRTTFIGQGGLVLDVVEGLAPRYRISGSEGYVRARVDDSNHLSAWTQPRFLA